MNKINFNEVIEAIIGGEGVVKATKYLNPKLVVRATRTLYGKRLPAKNQNIEITLTIGRPNYVEREFVKACLKAGEPFPVKRTIIKFYNSKRSAMKAMKKRK